MDRPAVHFQCPKTVKHLDVAKAIQACSLSLGDVLQIDLHGRPGSCVLTLRDFATRDKLVAANLQLEGKSIDVLPGDGTVSATRVYIYGCEPALHLGHIESALGEFGEIVGNIDCEFVTVEKFKILTGVRRVLMILKKGVPCKLSIQKRSYRTHHRDQIQTCFRCGVSGHQARDCPARPNTARTRTHHTSYSTVVQGQAADRMADDSPDVLVHVQEPTGAEPNPGAAIAGEATDSNCPCPPKGSTTLEGSNQQQQQQHCDKRPPKVSKIPVRQAAYSVPVATPTTLPAEEATRGVPAFPLSRGKGCHSSPDDEGFIRASGKHTFSARVLAFDPQVAWANEASAKEMHRLAQRVRSRRGSQ